MTYLSVAFTVTRTYFQSIDTNGNFKLGEPLKAYCDIDGQILDCPHNGPLEAGFDASRHELYSSTINTPEMLAQAAINLGCTKAAIFQNWVVTDRSGPIDSVSYLDFYKCFFYSEYEAVLQTISLYFEHINFY